LCDRERINRLSLSRRAAARPASPIANRAFVAGSGTPLVVAWLTATLSNAQFNGMLFASVVVSVKINVVEAPVAVKFSVLPENHTPSLLRKELLTPKSKFGAVRVVPL
jgi:hypothetical protein